MKKKKFNWKDIGTIIRLRIKRRYSYDKLIKVGFTTKEKIYIFECVLEYLRDWVSWHQDGVCIILGDWFLRICGRNKSSLFPEFFAYKPKDRREEGDFWFSNNTERVVVVEKVIEDLKAKL